MAGRYLAEREHGGPLPHFVSLGFTNRLAIYLLLFLAAGIVGGFYLAVLSIVSANQKMSFFAGMKCNFMAVSIRWICSLDYPLLVGLKPVKS